MYNTRLHWLEKLSGGLNNVVFRLIARLFLGKVDKVDTSNIRLYTHHMDIMASTHWVFIFTVYLVKHLGLVGEILGIPFPY